MLRGIKRRLDESKERREQQRQEVERREQEALQARLRAQREKQEIQRKVLAILEEGKVPDMHLSVDVPFKLQKNEKWLLAVNNVAYAEMRTKREVVGRSAGASVRVMKGVSVRTGASRGTPVETDVLTPRGSGTFAISTKHVFFQGERSFRIPMANGNGHHDGIGPTVELVPVNAQPANGNGNGHHDETPEPQQSLFSWAEFMAEEPVKPKGRGRKPQPAATSLFEWALEMEQEREEEPVGAGR